jgi:hypothetical protein
MRMMMQVTIPVEVGNHAARMGCQGRSKTRPVRRRESRPLPRKLGFVLRDLRGVLAVAGPMPATFACARCSRRPGLSRPPSFLGPGPKPRMKLACCWTANFPGSLKPSSRADPPSGPDANPEHDIDFEIAAHLTLLGDPAGPSGLAGFPCLAVTISSAAPAPGSRSIRRPTILQHGLLTADILLFALPGTG